MREAIRLGDVGPEVRDVQSRLVRLVDPELRADGVFGAATEQAVRRFQRDRGLAADGIVNLETWRSLVEASYTLGDRLLWHSAALMRGDDVRELQHLLNLLGFDAGPEDGLFGPLARAAVEEFQRNAGLNVDGVAGPATVQALRRLRRHHQSGGIAVRVREREALRRLGRRGLTGARILVDPSRGLGDPGHVGVAGLTEAEVTWGAGRRVAARLAARGALALLSRGPRSNPSPSERARLANEQGVDLVLSIAVAAYPGTAACGSASYYYGGRQFVSESGERLAGMTQDAMVAAGWAPDCRTHPVTTAIVRETRMPTVVVEPGFITSPRDAARLSDRTTLETLAAALVDALTRFLATAGADEPAVPVGPAGPAGQPLRNVGR